MAGVTLFPAEDTSDTTYFVIALPPSLDGGFQEMVTELPATVAVGALGEDGAEGIFTGVNEAAADAPIEFTADIV